MPVRERRRRERHRIGRHHRQLVFVHLQQIEARAPRGDVLEWTRRAKSRRLHAQHERMQIAVDRAAIVLPDQLRRLELELEAADQVDVQRIEIAEQRLESEPVPRRHAAGQSLAASLVAVVAQLDAIVRVRHRDRRRVRRGATQRAR